MTETYCSNCGHSLDDDANFCPSCGKPLTRTKTETDVNSLSGIPAEAGVRSEEESFPQPGDEQSEPRWKKPASWIQLLGIVATLLTLAVVFGGDGVDYFIGTILLIAGLVSIITGLVRSAISWSIRRSRKFIGGGTVSVFLGIAAMDTGVALGLLGVCGIVVGLAWIGIVFIRGGRKRKPLILIGLGFLIADEGNHIASQWQLMWWWFKKHKPAMVSGVILTLIAGGAFPTVMAVVAPIPIPTTKVAPTPSAFNGDGSTLVLLPADFTPGWQLITQEPQDEGYQSVMVKISVAMVAETVNTWVRVFPDSLSAQTTLRDMRDERGKQVSLGESDIGSVAFSDSGDMQFKIFFVSGNVLALVHTFSGFGGSLRESEKWARVLEAKIDAAMESR